MNTNRITINGRNSQDLIMLHGWGQTLDSMEPLAEAMAENFRVITVDLPGHGAAKDNPGPYTFSRYMDEIAAAAKFGAAKSFHLLGWSMGGSIAAQYVLELREPKPDSIILMNAPARFIGPKGSGMGQNLASIDRLIGQLEDDHTWALKTFIEFFFVSGEPIEPELERLIREALLPRATFPPAKEALLATLQELKGLDLTRHSAIPMSARGLIINGALDRICPVGGQALWDDVFMDLAKAPMEDCGHAPHLTRLDDTVSAITNFLQGP